MSTIPPELGQLTPCVLHQRSESGVHVLTLNRPSSFNALSADMLCAMQSVLGEVAADGSARALVIAAEGKAFCAGHDLKEIAGHVGIEQHQALFGQCSRMMLAIQSLGVPVIARVQGLATAAGCQLVAQCDLAVAASSATFGVNGIDVGLFCATPSVPLSRVMLPKQAFEMLVTGQFIDAHEAKLRGLVNRVATIETLDSELDSLVVALLSKPKEALAIGKALFYRQRETGLAAAYQLAGQAMACNMAHPVAQEGVAAFVQKRQPNWAL
jgi:enoyl-CoA hydratase/carnithine racemase